MQPTVPEYPRIEGVRGGVSRRRPRISRCGLAFLDGGGRQLGALRERAAATAAGGFVRVSSTKTGLVAEGGFEPPTKGL